MKENKIQKIVDDPVNSYVVMTSVNLAKPDDFSDTAAVLSDYTTYYMSTSHYTLPTPFTNNFYGATAQKPPSANLNIKTVHFPTKQPKK